ncbi:hypothetical protein JCM3775_003202 [Rhodotorula graminis]|uniref:Threonylcarbamoyl-AMP synthase n=1 Tax=Rhodotorula graminis (strain WP1) TaxID=578459 RepID=A0A194SCP0_RHOGW|nr:uncharacterized protein RHOBADRAFT_52107 [Rhodotorula graminis WP1]KPV77161.1 hypothetical protein RHOBADRAFT_52107 [Rhodotorula graminis WP1]
MASQSARASPVASTSTPPADPPARAQLLATSPDSTLASSLETASSLLHAHLPVAFPSETVYGLGASALSSTAVKRIFAAKGRPSDNPLIVHVSSRDMLLDLLPSTSPDAATGADAQPQEQEQARVPAAVPRMYDALMKRFWPGPLSLVFPLVARDAKGKGRAVDPPRLAVAPEVTAGHDSLCVRMPSHPLALALIRQANLPLAAPSANLSSRPSPTTAKHVVADLGEGRGVGAVLDGGECEVGVESTVVDWVQPAEGGEGELRILRAGGVSAEDIEACLADAGFLAARAQGDSGRIQVYSRDFRSQDLEDKPTTPGMKYKHYAPGNAKVILVKPVSSADAGDFPLPSLQDLIQLTALTHTPVAAPPADDTTASNMSTADEPTAPRFRVGLMLNDSTLAALSASTLSTVTPSCALIRLPPAPESPFANLAVGEESNLPDLDEVDVLSFSLGDRERPIEAAQRLFAGLRFLDALPEDLGAVSEERVEGQQEEEGKGVDLIFVEAVREEGVGLAVMERARKAAGGAGEMEFAL